MLDFAELRDFVDLQAEELLLGDDGPARLRGDGPGRRRHPAGRRGARGRRRVLRAEVHGRVPRRCAARAGRSCSSPTTWRRCRASAIGRCCIHDGERRYIGDPEEAALRYYRAELRRRPARTGRGQGGVPDVNVRVVDAWLRGRGRRARRERRAGRADRPRRRLRGAPRPRGPRVRLPLRQRRRRARSSASTGR